MKRIIFFIAIILCLGNTANAQPFDLDLNWTGICSPVFVRVYALDASCNILDHTVEVAVIGTGSGGTQGTVFTTGNTDWSLGVIPSGMVDYQIDVYTKCTGTGDDPCPDDFVSVGDNLCGLSPTACMERTCDLCGTSNIISVSLGGSYASGYTLTLVQ